MPFKSNPASLFTTSRARHPKKKRNHLIFIGSVGLSLGLSRLYVETLATPAYSTVGQLTILAEPASLKPLDATELQQQRLTHHQQNYPEMMGQFYQAIQPVKNPEDLLVLVNKNYQLDPTYEPSDLTRPNVRTVSGSTNPDLYLREEAAHQLEKMFQDALAENVHLIARSGYRSYQTQVALYQRYVRANGVAYTDGISAKPGHSEHQTGLAIDVTSDEVQQELSQQFANTIEGKWLAERAHEYGFIIRYPKNREADTGYRYEPWHLRYVGQEVATLLKERNWIFEEYVLIYQR